MAGHRTEPCVAAALSLLALCSEMAFAQTKASRDPDLATFSAWLDTARAGYGCDEGPARFHNSTVEAAYPGRRFYYVLSYTRGIPPPFRRPTTLVAEVASGQVRVLSPSSLESYREGLRRVDSDKDARLAAAAVMILSTRDPGQRRWRFDPALFRVKRSRDGWVCTYALGGPRYASRVVFDRNGTLESVEANAPPVP